MTTGHAPTEATSTALVPGVLPAIGLPHVLDQVRVLHSMGPSPADRLPAGHPALVLLEDAAEMPAAGVSRLAALTEASTTEDAHPSREWLAGMFDPEDATDADDDDEDGQTPAAVLAAAELAMSREAAAERAAEAAAHTAAWLAEHGTPVAELLTLTVPATTGPAETGRAPEDHPPPPELLALTTSVLTSAPPAPAPPVSGAATAVPVAA